MKTRHVLFGATAVLLIILGGIVLRLLNLHSIMTGAVGVRFVGLSKGTHTTFTRSLAPHYGRFLIEWLSSGTNVALFTITNGQNRSVLLYPYVGFFDRTNAARSRYETVLPASASAYGMRLRPGETATVGVAILPREGAGFVRFGSVPDYRDAFPRMTEEFRGLITNRARPTFQTEWIYSEKIIP